jgi:general secretion pathway protein G
MISGNSFGFKVKKKGFTLIEMLVVMAVIALLLTIVTPRYFASLDKSRDIALQENLKIVRVTLDKFNADKGRFPDTLEELVDKKYLRDVPVDPVTGTSLTWILDQAIGEDESGIQNIRSGAAGLAYDGRRYDAL